MDARYRSAWAITKCIGENLTFRVNFDKDAFSFYAFCASSWNYPGCHPYRIHRLGPVVRQDSAAEPLNAEPLDDEVHAEVVKDIESKYPGYSVRHPVSTLCSCLRPCIETAER